MRPTTRLGREEKARANREMRARLEATTAMIQAQQAIAEASIPVVPERDLRPYQDKNGQPIVFRRARYGRRRP
jgi:hypothetical protein